MIYTYKQLPQAWVVLHNGRHWIVPACHNGWLRRAPFRGYVSSLEIVQNYNLIGLGIK